VVSAIYCDTSVVVAYYVPETHSAQAEQVLDGHTQRVISPLVLTEVSSAFRRKVHDKVLSRADAQGAWEDFKQDVVTGIFRLTELERRHYDHAAATMWQAKDRLRTLDAIHLAVADLDGCTMATADDLMAKVGKDLGISVRWAGA
jgi:predicted nucleic acid-binding protein